MAEKTRFEKEKFVLGPRNFARLQAKPLESLISILSRWQNPKSQLWLLSEDGKSLAHFSFEFKERLQVTDETVRGHAMFLV
jgi:hypothetical protein